MRKSLSLLLALVIALLAFGAIAAATHPFSGDFIQTVQPEACKPNACDPEPSPEPPLIAGDAEEIRGA